MKKLLSLFKPKWKHSAFDAEVELKQNKSRGIDVEEINSTMTEIELRDR